MKSNERICQLWWTLIRICWSFGEKYFALIIETWCTVTVSLTTEGRDVLITGLKIPERTLAELGGRFSVYVLWNCIMLVVQGYASPNIERREPMLERKRSEYHNFVEQYYRTRHQDIHRDTYRQVTLLSLCLEWSLPLCNLRVIFKFIVFVSPSGYACTWQMFSVQSSIHHFL